MTNAEREGERTRMRDVLKTALERGYSDAQLRQYIEGAVEMREGRSS